MPMPTVFSPAPSSPAGLARQADDGLDLLRRWAATGDAEAFARIVHQYAGCVYATCLRVLGDSARAQDVSQETFFRLMRRPGDVTVNLGGWLHRTATHLSLDALRSENSRHRREIVYATECTHEASSWAELSPCVDQAMTELPEELRTLLVDHYLLGKTQAELAERTGLSAATISRRVKQGLEELRRHLRLKGVFALPAALAGLLCHVAARQAPASLTTELGKMALLGGSAGRKAMFRAPLQRPLASKVVDPRLLVPLIGSVLAILLVEWMLSAGPLSANHAAAAPPPDAVPHSR
ncbi:MAG: sigma-70 family RNA polymerase sigma factor [Tepidisphaeraceae bacterium]